MSPLLVLRRIAAAAVLTTVFAACGSASADTGGQPIPAPTTGSQGPSATQPASTTEPAPSSSGAIALDGPTGLCVVLPAERAAAALGEPVGPAIAKHNAAFSNASCTYDSTASNASITIWYYPRMTRDEWESAMAKVGMTAAMTVPGLGDAAFRRDSKSAPARVKLAVFEGDHGLWVNITNARDLPTMAAAAEREARALLTALR